MRPRSEVRRERLLWNSPYRSLRITIACVEMLRYMRGRFRTIIVEMPLPWQGERHCASDVRA